MDMGSQQHRITYSLPIINLRQLLFLELTKSMDILFLLRLKQYPLSWNRLYVRTDKTRWSVFCYSELFMRERARECSRQSRQITVFALSWDELIKKVRFCNKKPQNQKNNSKLFLVVKTQAQRKPKVIKLIKSLTILFESKSPLKRNI